jgi:hypothetical protein
MANSEHLAILCQGVEHWNTWRRANPDIEPDLTGADISELAATRSDLGTAQPVADAVRLPAVNLDGSRLQRARFAGMTLMRATMRNADASGVILSMAKLMLLDCRGAKLQGADFSGSDLRMADLSRADLSNARFGDNVFGGTKFRDAQGLSSCIHIMPSTIDLRTLALSGCLPVSFLRGCGLPDRIIEYLPSLLLQPIQFHSCFISYSSTDQDFARRLHADLQAKGVRCWFAPRDIVGGQKLHDQIEQAIHINDKLLLILSESSMGSNWVATEIACARRKELQQQRQVLFPVAIVPFDTIRAWKCFDADIGRDSAKEVREYFIPDFSRWRDHDCYCESFDRLLKSLVSDPKRRSVE